MPDPFPGDDYSQSNFIIPKVKEDMVYEESRYKKGESPKSIYVPSHILMFKLMRACINVTAPEDLWFNKED